MHAKRILWTSLALLTGFTSIARATDYRLEKQLPLAAAATLVLTSDVGAIQVRGAGPIDPKASSVTAGFQGATFLLTSERTDFAEIYSVHFETPSPDRIEVVIERKSRGLGSWFGDHKGRTTVEVTLPRSAAVEIKSSGGGIHISNLEGKVTASSSGGGVQVTNLGGTANLSSSGGAISAENVAGDIDASSTGGGVEIRDAHGAVVAGSSGGAVSVAFAAGNAHGGRLDSSGGGVSARVDPAVGLEIDASSSGGSVSCDLPVTGRTQGDRDTVRGTLNGGGALLKLRSSGGGIAISSR